MSNPEPVLLGRKRTLPACPNPLFLKWLTELRDEAREKGLKIQYTYQKAINSLNKYPLPLRDAKEAKILQNFGDGICKILDSKLQQYLTENGQDSPIHALPEGVSSPGRSDNNKAPPTKKKNAREKEGGEKKKREYLPQKGSGGYAVLLTLYRQLQMPGSKGFMFKMELQAEAQHLCNKSFAVPDLGSKYTAWSSVATLVQRNLLVKTHSPARYSLTQEGVSLAQRLDSVEPGSKAGPHVIGDEEEEGGPAVVDLTGSGDEDEEEEEKDIIQLTQPMNEVLSRGCLLPGTYDIVLCVDFIETTGGSHHRKHELVKELQTNGVHFDVRKLNVGDFLWVAREKVAPMSAAGRELVLDFVIERKRMDDLCGSIIDGRFKEQKFRLKRCGLRKPIYLVEEQGKAAAHLSLPEKTLQQAIVNTQVVDGFFVKRVQDVRESAAYLSIMTRYLTKVYQNRTLVCRSRERDGDPDCDDDPRSCSLMSFAEFNYGAIKNKSQTVREAFARQLMQVSGLSGERAAAILEQYSTPHSLLKTYDKCKSEAQKEKLLSTIQYGRLNRKLGPALSRTLYQLYCSNGALY
ncbi:crossover junction endonuclease MUS81 [Nerophis ophidion]|uniref:crossover junction endonuclease MUS81 n=1 Tax=Nerophis ophidion TaxID=159077 RepID=UPI002AE038BF|nr:crossover junction endonuclease MUS81 [Nerophis ophidion]XP_061769055.1 crossover junction endonuclease MUS81 [Nerophis ophidion]XP_061769056.1 crossover junction endonuclease MUS81 [Nerophis ophidion]XP_061769057.1 crossover junction endonuclease MUS81 [Nerophis ophidion]XP_061769058.1 crossover junction endonuclease MUS81 [Nerophis ophidion]XP_061769059.1 crossover junction endonuclease MUS81 [Nerophis ophidion]XP_061769060.1 crossover junction endonuclease MUS81 [Nerophis ophidion]